jgi:hypothetical protein
MTGSKLAVKSWAARASACASTARSQNGSPFAAAVGVAKSLDDSVGAGPPVAEVLEPVGSPPESLSEEQAERRGRVIAKAATTTRRLAAKRAGRARAAGAARGDKVFMLTQRISLTEWLTPQARNLHA